MSYAFMEYPTVSYNRVFGVYDVYYPSSSGCYTVKFLRWENGEGSVIYKEDEFLLNVESLHGSVIVEGYIVI